MMASKGMQIVGGDYRELRASESIGEALKRIVRDRHQAHAAKRIERAWGLDARTARNVATEGNVSERTLTKAIKAEGWDLLLELGAELTGETFEEFEERRQQRIIEEAKSAQETVRILRAKRAALDKRAIVALDAFDRSLDDRQRNRAGRGR
ncbi:hypothetical protein [Caulobacter segnis]